MARIGPPLGGSLGRDQRFLRRWEETSFRLIASLPFVCSGINKELRCQEKKSKTTPSLLFLGEHYQVLAMQVLGSVYWHQRLICPHKEGAMGKMEVGAGLTERV